MFTTPAPETRRRRRRTWLLAGAAAVLATLSLGLLRSSVQAGDGRALPEVTSASEPKRAAGAEPRREAVVIEPMPAVTVPIEAAVEAATSSSASVESRHAFRISGTVVGEVLDVELQQKLQGAEVVASVRDTVIGRARADAEGRFDFAVSTTKPLQDVTLRLSVSAPGFHSALRELDLSGLPEEVEASFVLGSGARVTLRVLDHRHRPIASGLNLIEIQRLEPTPGEPLQVLRDSGSWTRDCVPRGRYRLTARAEGHGRAVLTFEVPTNETNVIDLGDVVLRAGAVLRGRLVLPDGSPVAGFWTTFWSEDLPVEAMGHALESGHAERASDGGLLWARAATAEDGSFSTGGMEPGVYRFSSRAYLPHWGSKNPVLDLELHTDDFREIEMDLHRIAIRIEDAKEGRYRCAVLPVGAPKIALIFDDVSADAIALLPVSPDLELIVAAQEISGASFDERLLTVRPDQGVTELTMRPTRQHQPRTLTIRKAKDVSIDALGAVPLALGRTTWSAPAPTAWPMSVELPPRRYVIEGKRSHVRVAEGYVDLSAGDGEVTLTEVQGNRGGGR